MKFHQHGGDDVEIRWGDHVPGCKNGCRDVDLERAGSYGKCCAQGAPLLTEFLRIRHAPEEAARKRLDHELAQDAGMIKSRVSVDTLRTITRYKE
jgi:hypothetical protein